MSISKVSVLGLGYIGLPTAAVIASRGLNVIGVDVNKHAVDTINLGLAHIVEPNLDYLVKNVVGSGYLKATMTIEPADAFIIAVPTPFRNEPGREHCPDLSFIKSACDEIAKVLKKGDLVILESTSPVGTTEKVAAWLAQSRNDLTFPQCSGVEADVNIAHCPERVIPGYVLEELVSNDRVIGGISPKCCDRAVELYKTFVQGECIATNARTAEMAKLTENSFRDVNIAFANELSIICDKLDINVWDLIKLTNRHPRVNVLQPGPGVGGHCIAVDPWFIVDSCPEEAKIIKQARLTNDAKPGYVIRKVQAEAKKYSNPTIACLGLAFKADIDDLRESPSVEIVESIAQMNIGEVLAVEPNIQQLPNSLSSTGVELVSYEQAISRADIVVLLVDHQQFKEIDKKALFAKVLIDTRGVILLSEGSDKELELSEMYELA